MKSLIISVVVCATLLTATIGVAAEPQWIWSPENAAAPIGDCYFRRTFDLAAPESGRVEVTCDNVYRLFVNGVNVGSGNNWQQIDAYDIQRHLVKGRNIVAVHGLNSDGPNPAGFVARLIVKSKGSDAVDLSTGKEWKTNLKPVDGWRDARLDDSAWKPAHLFGELGKTAPWGDTAKLPAVPKTPEFVAKERPAGPFQLLDGDRVVFVGDTLIERAQSNDYIETMMTSRYPDRNILFRNLGWSGDDVSGVARSGFGTAEDGFKQLQQQVFDFKPTVIFVGYGANASYNGPAGLEDFRAGYLRMLAMLETTRATMILLSPIRQEDLGRPLPNPERHNQNRVLYGATIQQIANERGHLFVDLYATLGSPSKNGKSPSLTDNGVHLTPYGYWQAARTLEDDLAWTPWHWELNLTAEGKVEKAGGTKVSEAQIDGGTLRFTLLEDRLPLPAAGKHAGLTGALRIQGLPAGKFTLFAGDMAIQSGTAAEWAEGRGISAGSNFEQAEALRKTILAKNQLYFHRWRPQNETYLFGFRKHEQGQNAKEIPMFDPLVAEQEAQIAKLRVPQPLKYELRPAK